MNKRIVGIYSIIHFIIDLSCAILVGIKKYSIIMEKKA